MSDNKTPTELNRVTAEKGREEAEDLREAADHERGSAEGAPLDGASSWANLSCENRPARPKSL